MVKFKDPDPLAMDGLEPDAIQAAVDQRKNKPTKAPSELDLKKEERLHMKEQRLSTGTGGKAASSAAEPPPVAMLSPEERAKLLDKLGAYRERFPWLKSRNKSLRSAEDIMDELHYTELQLGGQGSRDTNLGGTLLYGAMSAIEYGTQIWNPLNLNLTGLGSMTKQNMPEFQDIVDELMIKYGGNFTMPAEYRLCLAMGTLILTVHTVNQGDPALAEALKRAQAHVQPTSRAKDL